MEALFNLIKQSQKTESETNADSSYLIVGLGNPGREYRNTRHNIGFLAIDALARSLNVTLGKVQSKALVGQGKIGVSKVILVKPQTYMNLSGQAVSGLLNFYKISTEHLIVIHDDIDLPFGTIRIRPGGGSAGQKGVNSIIEKVGTQEFARMRLGVGRPPGQMDAAAYVLQPFTKEDEEFLVNFMAKAAEAVGEFVNNGLNAAMNKYNGTI